MQSDLVSIPVFKVTSNSVVNYTEWPEGMPNAGNSDYKEAFMPEDSTASGQVTRKVYMRMKNIIKAWNTALDSLNRSHKHKNFFTGRQLKFVTLTLPATQVHSDKEIKRQMLRPFLQQLARKFDLKRWMWKAERQKNGNLHFHLLTDTYIHWKELRNQWNHQLQRHGYIQAYAQKWQEKDKHGFQLHPEFGGKASLEKQKKAYDYRLATNYQSPNSTDVHNTRKINNVEAYMSKYMAKDEEENVIEGKIWDCSSNLKEVRNFVDQESIDMNRLISLLDSDPRCHRFDDDYFTVWSGPIMQIIAEKVPSIMESIAEHYVREFFGSPPDSPSGHEATAHASQRVGTNSCPPATASRGGAGLQLPFAV